MAETERVWLVERTYGDKGLVTLVYATPDGDRHVTMQRSAVMLQSRDVTAAVEVDPERLARTDDPAARERYADEAARMAERHEADETV